MQHQSPPSTSDQNQNFSKFPPGNIRYHLDSRNHLMFEKRINTVMNGNIQIDHEFNYDYEPYKQFD